MRKYENTHACSGIHCAGAGGMAPYIPKLTKQNNFNRDSQKAHKDVSYIIHAIKQSLKGSNYKKMII
jgi:hypothetical protein